MRETILILTEFSKYIFVAIAAIALFLVVDNSLAEYVFRKEAIGDGAGRFFGRVRIRRAADPALTGQSFGLKWETCVGSGNRCDIRIPARFIEKRHMILYLARDCVHVTPVGKSEVWINDERAMRGDAVYDGDVLTIGAVSMVLQLWEDER